MNPDINLIRAVKIWNEKSNEPKDEKLQDKMGNASVHAPTTGRLFGATFYTKGKERIEIQIGEKIAMIAAESIEIDEREGAKLGCFERFNFCVLNVYDEHAKKNTYKKVNINSLVERLGLEGKARRDFTSALREQNANRQKIQNQQKKIATLLPNNKERPTKDIQEKLTMELDQLIEKRTTLTKRITELLNSYLPASSPLPPTSPLTQTFPLEPQPAVLDSLSTPQQARLANDPTTPLKTQKESALEEQLVFSPDPPPQWASRPETEVQQVLKTSSPKYQLDYAFDKDSDAYKESIASSEKRARASEEFTWDSLFFASEPLWNPFESLVDHPGLAYLLPPGEEPSLLNCLQKAFEKDPDKLLDWIKVNPDFFKEKFKNQDIPFELDFSNGKSLTQVKRDILLSIPVTELQISGEFNFVDNYNKELQDLHSTLNQMKHLKKLDTEYARDLYRFHPDPFDQELYGLNGFLSDLNVNELSIWASVGDLETLSKLPSNIEKLTIRAEKDNRGFDKENEKIRHNLEKLPLLKEITLCDMPENCAEFLRNIPDKCRVLNIETCRYFHIPVEALIKRFQESPLETLCLKNYEGYSRSQYTEDDIKKLKKAKIAEKIIVEFIS